VNDGHFFHDPTGAPGAGPAPQPRPANPFGSAPDGSDIEIRTPREIREQLSGHWSSWRSTLARIRHVEGPRGVAVRWSVLLRYVGYLVLIVVCSAAIGRSFTGTSWASGGTIVLFGSTAILVTAAVATMFMPDRRTEILEEMRRYLFQVLLFPSTGIAVAYWFLREFTDDPGADNAFLRLLDTYLPILFLLPAVMSVIVFIKAIAGLRMLNRTTADSEEMVATWTRQDYHQP
jgi:hypothetical protein